MNPSRQMGSQSTLDIFVVFTLYYQIKGRANRNAIKNRTNVACSGAIFCINKLETITVLPMIRAAEPYAICGKNFSNPRQRCARICILPFIFALWTLPCGQTVNTICVKTVNHLTITTPKTPEVMMQSWLILRLHFGKMCGRYQD